jgi:hypothetical protein
VDLPLKNAGKLSIEIDCKGYRRVALLQPSHSILSKISKQSNDFVVQVKLHHDC